VVRIPAAGRSFLMGSPEHEPGRLDNEVQHEVRFTRDWWLGVYPVTQAQYRAVTGRNPSQFKRIDLPVERVSWDDAAEFCRKLSAKTGRSVRLPTESEWEFSCRAGTTAATHFGDSLSSSQANFDGTFPYNGGDIGPHLKRTSAVGSYPPNAFGLYDMHGNVWEWCADWYGEYPTGPAADPGGPEAGELRVLRGGSWDYSGRYCRCAVRNWFAPEYSYSVIGFRVAVTCA
jgi:formylglycine-generating enzyme required for sulfatase activity